MRNFFNVNPKFKTAFLFLVFILISLVIFLIFRTQPPFPSEKSNNFEQEKSSTATADGTTTTTRPKNIIIMISDGAGFNHYAAAGIFTEGKTKLRIFDKFAVKLALSTYPANGSYSPTKSADNFDYVLFGATDSAAAATALSTGKKTYNGAIGVAGSKQDPEILTHALEKAEKSGKKTGVITSVPFSHATPAGFVAHNPDRNNYREIAEEMIVKSSLDLIIGCGNPEYSRDGKKLNSPNSFKYVGSKSIWSGLINGGDNFDLDGDGSFETQAPDADGDGDSDPWFLIQSKKEFVKFSSLENTERLIGVPQVFRTLQQERSGNVNDEPFEVPFIESVPNLSQMVRVGLNVLGDNPDGFFLMIEGGAIDCASHKNQTGRMIEEEIDFIKAVKTVTEWVDENSNWDETLLIVTSDHETGYLTGPAKELSLKSSNEDSTPQKTPEVEWHSKAHTNSLVPFYAVGRGSELFLKFADEKDSLRNSYLDNAEVGKVLFKLLNRN